MKSVVTVVALVMMLSGCAEPAPADEPTPSDPALCGAGVARDPCGFTDDTLCPAQPPAEREACDGEGVGCSWCIGDIIEQEFVCDLGRWVLPEDACLPLP